MTEKDYRKEGEEMEKKKKKKYSRTDKVILGIGFTILGLFVLSIAIPIIYVVLASFMDPTVLNNQGLSFNIKDWTLDAYRRVLENEMIWRGFLNSFLYNFEKSSLTCKSLIYLPHCCYPSLPPAYYTLHNLDQLNIFQQ